ncbi:MAG TPA: hypothetical protein VGD61_01110 [Pyrinomonadaceae bacterium]
MKILVRNRECQSSSHPSEVKRDRDYEVDLDFIEAVSLFRRLRSSRISIHLGAQNYAIDFLIGPDDPIQVEIMSFVDDFWGMSEISDSDAESILEMAYRGERFTGVIPGSGTEWDAWSDGSGLPWKPQS